MSQRINILIRASRPDLLQRCLYSIRRQTYENIHLIVSVEDTYEGGVMAAMIKNYLDCYDVEFIRVAKQSGYSHHWNLYCNELKSKVTDGWFFYMDDDDMLSGAYAIETLEEYLSDTSKGVICQFLRNGKPKPSDALIEAQRIELGRIGGGCIVLHHTHKDIANWDGERAADFRFITDVSKSLPLLFIKHVLQITTNNGLHGKKTSSGNSHTQEEGNN